MKLITDYNSITKDEYQKQFLLRVVRLFQTGAKRRSDIKKIFSISLQLKN